MLGAYLREIGGGDVAGLAPRLFVFGTDQRKTQWLFRAHRHDWQRGVFSREVDFRVGTARIGFNIPNKREIFRGYLNRSPNNNLGAIPQFKRIGLSDLDGRGRGPPLWVFANSVSAPPSTETQTLAFGLSAPASHVSVVVP